MKTSPKFPHLVQSETAIRSIHLCVGAIVIGWVFWRLQFSTESICCGDFDGYYHIKWSELLWESMRSRSFPPVFTWLPLTTLNANDYVDHHFLFHVFQIPFIWFSALSPLAKISFALIASVVSIAVFFGYRLRARYWKGYLLFWPGALLLASLPFLYLYYNAKAGPFDLVAAAKIAATIFASLAVFSCYWLLVHYQIRYVVIWLLALLACSAPFLYRLNMAKAPPFAIIYLVLGIHLLFKKRYWPLVLLAFLFTLTYDMFLVLIFAGFIWVAVVAWTERRFEWRPIVWILLGTTAGLIINPYFPHNFHLLYEHLTMKLTSADYATKVGSEWYPYNTWEFFGNTAVASVAMIVGYLAFDPSNRKDAPHQLFFLVFSTALMIMTARWRRIAEYWPPFAVMFSAFALKPWLAAERSPYTKLPSEFLDELQPFFDIFDASKSEMKDNQEELLKTVAAVLVAIVLGGIFFFNLRTTTKDIAHSEEPDYYKGGADWIRDNVPSGQVVFNTDWDDFPRLFYYDPTHNYVSGLDPTYLYDRNPDLSRLNDRITLGDEEDPGPLIRDRFGARYVFTDNSHDKFYDSAIQSGWFEIVYEDKDCTVLHIRDEKGEAPPEEPDTNDSGGDEPDDNGG